MKVVGFVPSADTAKSIVAWSIHTAGVVAIYVAADEAVDRSLEAELRTIVREEMNDDEISVHVIAVQRIWKD